MMNTAKESEFMSYRAFRLDSGSFKHLINSFNMDTVTCECNQKAHSVIHSTVFSIPNKATVPEQSRQHRGTYDRFSDRIHSRFRKDNRTTHENPQFQNVF